MNVLAYLTIAARAEAIGWPLCHATDLTVKDAHTCGALSPGDAFLWVLRETGTTILLAHPDLDAILVESRLASYERFNGPCRYFWWDGAELSDLTDAEEAAYVLEHWVSEMRHASRRCAPTMPPSALGADTIRCPQMELAT